MTQAEVLARLLAAGAAGVRQAVERDAASRVETPGPEA